MLTNTQVSLPHLSLQSKTVLFSQPLNIMQPIIISKVLKKFLIGASLFIISLLNYRSILWPGPLPDKSFKEPLPPGKLSCPWAGVLFNIYSPFNLSKKGAKFDFHQSRMRFIYAFFHH